MSITKIIYSSTIDLSKPYGPGVNEREFVNSFNDINDIDIQLIIHSFLYPFKDTLPGPTVIIGKTSKNPLAWLKFQLRWLQLLLRTSERAAFYVFRLDFIPLAVFIFILLKKPRYAVKTAGDGTFAFVTLKGKFFAPLKYLAKTVHGYILRNAISIDAVSQLHVSSLSRVYRLPSHKVHVIDNAVNTERFKPLDRKFAAAYLDLDASNIYIGYLGNFPLIRGGEQLVRVLPGLLSKFPHLRLIITGDDPGTEQLINLAKQSKLIDKIHFVGRVPFETMPYLANMLSVGVSFLAPQYQGASEQKVRQYLSCGIPVVASPGSSSFICDTGLGKICNFDDIDSIMESIEFYLSMSELEVCALRKYIRQFAVDNLSVAASTKKRLALWESNLNR